MNPIVESLLLRSVVLILLVGSLAGLVVGALLLLSPHRLRAVSDILNRWISTRHLNQALDRSVEIDFWFYRHRRVSGGLILLASGYILYSFTAGLDRVNAVIGLSRHFSLPSAVVSILLDSLVLSVLLGASFAAFVSLFLLLRPSMLRELEQVSNRWVSLRRVLKSVEVRRGGVDEYMYRHGREAGILLMLGSLYILTLLSTWIGH